MLTPHNDIIEFYSLDDAEYWLQEQLDSVRRCKSDFANSG